MKYLLEMGDKIQKGDIRPFIEDDGEIKLKVVEDCVVGYEVDDLIIIRPMPPGAIKAIPKLPTLEDLPESTIKNILDKMREGVKGIAEGLGEDEKTHVIESYDAMTLRVTLEILHETLQAYKKELKDESDL